MQGKANSEKGGTAAAPARAPNASVEHVLSHTESPQQFCAALAKLFGVRPTEVALMRLERGLLSFLYPEQLKTAGSIPVSSSSAVAAHTASTRKTELHNAFVKVKHASIFESVKLDNPSDDIERTGQNAIQKLMSAPILDPQRKVLGVIQVCRKGFDVPTAGPDFTQDDLQQLELAAKVLSTLPFVK
jgi:GAF domain-containing protein